MGLQGRVDVPVGVPHYYKEYCTKSHTDKIQKKGCQEISFCHCIGKPEGRPVDPYCLPRHFGSHFQDISHLIVFEHGFQNKAKGKAENDKGKGKDCLNDIGLFKACADPGDQKAQESGAQHGYDRKYQCKQHPHRINEDRRMDKEAVADQHGSRNAQIPGKAFDIHVKEPAAGHGPGLEGQGHEHVIFFEIKEISIGL